MKQDIRDLTTNPRLDAALLEKGVPVDDEAEQSVLGCMIVSDELRRLGLDLLKPAHFTRPTRQALFRGIAALIKNGQEIEPIALRRYLESAEAYSPMDSSVIVSEHIGTNNFSSTYATPKNFIQWCRILMEITARRYFLRAAQRAQMNVVDGEEDFQNVLDLMRDDLRRLENIGLSQRSTWIADILDDPRSQSAQVSGAVASGFAEMDQLLRGGGLLPGDLIFLGARTSRGKSTLARQIAGNVCARGRGRPVEEKPVALIFALEESKEATVRRLLGIRAELAYGSMQRGLYEGEEDERRKEQVRGMVDWRMAILDVRRLTLADIAVECRAVKQATGRLDVVVIDYLDLLQAGKEFGVHRTQELSYFTRELKIMAGDPAINAPLIVPVQIKREGLKGEKFDLSDFRGSGTIEQDADKCWIIQEPDEEMPDSYEVELTLAKQREGIVGSSRFTFYREFGGFGEVYGSMVRGQVGYKKKKPTRARSVPKSYYDADEERGDGDND